MIEMTETICSVRKPSMKRKEMASLIQEKSIQLFKEKGFDNVTVLDICKECSITKPTFYRFAATKGDLLSQHYGALLRDMPSKWDDPESNGGYFNCVMAGLNACLDALTADGYDMATQLLLQAIIIGDASLNIPESFEFRLSHLIEDGQRADVFENRQSADSLAATLVDLVRGYLTSWASRFGQTDIYRSVEQSAKAVLRPALKGGRVD